MVLASNEVGIAHHGAVADHLEVDREYERIVEACFGELLQHVVVERAEDAERGLAFVREAKAGRCGFLVVNPSTPADQFAPAASQAGAVVAFGAVGARGDSDQRAVRGRDSPRARRGAAGRELQRGGGAVGDVGRAGRDARRRRVPRRSSRDGRRARRRARDSRDEARDQGAAREAGGRSRIAGGAHRADRRASTIR